jgi:hypothetical protein
MIVTAITVTHYVALPWCVGRAHPHDGQMARRKSIQAHALTHTIFQVLTCHFSDAITMLLSSSFRRATTLVSRSTPVRSLNSSTRTLSSTSTSLQDSYDNIIATRQEGGVGLIQLHRPKALNALSDALFDDLIHASRAFDSNEEIGCLVVTGSTTAFAAGADIAEMSGQTFDQVYKKVIYINVLTYIYIHYVFINLLLYLYCRTCLRSGQILPNFPNQSLQRSMAIVWAADANWP